MIVTMYLPNVYSPDERGSGLAARIVRFSLEEAKHSLDRERVRDGEPVLAWTPILRDEKDGVQARGGGLIYEVLPVDVDISVDTLVKMKMKLEQGVTSQVST